MPHIEKCDIESNTRASKRKIADLAAENNYLHMTQHGNAEIENSMAKRVHEIARNYDTTKVYTRQMCKLIAESE